MSLNLRATKVKKNKIKFYEEKIEKYIEKKKAFLTILEVVTRFSINYVKKYNVKFPISGHFKKNRKILFRIHFFLNQAKISKKCFGGKTVFNFLRKKYLKRKKNFGGFLF